MSLDKIKQCWGWTVQLLDGAKFFLAFLGMLLLWSLKKTGWDFVQDIQPSFLALVFGSLMTYGRIYAKGPMPPMLKKISHVLAVFSLILGVAFQANPKWMAHAMLFVPKGQESVSAEVVPESAGASPTPQVELPNAPADTAPDSGFATEE